MKNALGRRYGLSRRDQQRMAKALVGRTVKRVSTKRLDGQPSVIATLVMDDGTRVEVEHIPVEG